VLRSTSISVLFKDWGRESKIAKNVFHFCHVILFVMKLLSDSQPLPETMRPSHFLHECFDHRKLHCHSLAIENPKLVQYRGIITSSIWKDLVQHSKKILFLVTETKRKVTLEILQEISTKLKVVTAANSGVRTEHRSVLFHNVQTRALTGTDRIVTFIASTDGLDRHGTKVMPMGINTDNYNNNPIILFGHDGYGGFFSTPDPANIIGKANALRKSERKLEVDIAFLDAETNPRADMLYRMVRAGAVNAVSIGFIPREVRVEDDGAGNQIPVIVRSELLEISVVPIPSLPSALATGNRSKPAVRFSHSY
jgi:HK97 family phage prohead protease